MRYRFGECVLTLDSRELRREAKAVAVTPQVFDLIAYLICHRERVIGKDELTANLWDGRIVSDAALTTRVYAARTAIGDSGKTQHFIKTVARRGIRFVGAVEEIDDAPRIDLAAARNKPSDAGVPVIAVAGFNNGNDPLDSRGIAAAMCEEVRVELTRLRWPKVVAMAEGPVLGPAAAHSANAQYTLSGRLRHARAECRITAELTNLSTRANIWAGRYDAAYPPGLTARRAIAAALVREAAGAIVVTERLRALAAQPDELSAWDAYQIGMWHMSGSDPDTIGLAQRSFRRAIESDARFAPAYSALAWSQMMAASIYSKMAVEEGCELGLPLVLRAIALDESDPEARARLALLEFLSGDVVSGIEEAEAVLAVSPDCASALGVKGAALISMGRHAGGRAALGQFLRLSPNDPVRPVRLTQVAISHYLEGNYAAAARVAKQVTRRFPLHPFAYRWLAAALGQLGRRDDAASALQALKEKWPDSFEMYVAKEPPSYCSAEYKPLLAGLRKAGWTA